ncbi:hypothetical protein [Vineibacter terrae]|uniref:hypothetical protein n=1 Tax=Vineibacter terrae TaxID=2586908 RepID=UPI002E376818|nr:hypothetical protein [Vineibacter terrae]HEX2884894.1 hypothetical protein [Vineibacter terrae]
MIRATKPVTPNMEMTRISMAGATKNRLPTPVHNAGGRVRHFRKRWRYWYHPHRLVGRFPAMRRAYSWLAAHAAMPRRPFGTNERNTLFPALAPHVSSLELRRHGLYPGLRLPAEMVAAIIGFAEQAPCARPGFDESFRYADIRHGRLADGQPVPIADMRRPAACADVATIRNDPGLRQAASSFLGYQPPAPRVRLFWSFAAALPDDTRRALGQTIDFHYDVPWFNGVYAYFYLTPSDRHSGAHVMYPGSARDKPLRFVLASSFRDESALAAYYGADRQVVVEGPAGFGFLEDPFGYHKALPPVRHDRLVLQLRYG